MRRCILAFAFVCVVRLAAHADPDKKLPFNIPAGSAADSVKQFVAQSGVQLLYAADDLNGVQTNAVLGDHTPFEAAELLLAGTSLSAVQGPNGAIGITRANGPKVPGAAPIPNAGSRPMAADETITLSPFEVQTGADTGYGALNSNSITNFNAALDHLPVSADIFDQSFMGDVAATSIESMIQTYSAGAGYGGITLGGASEATNQPGDRNSFAFTQLRGQSVPIEQRDSLLMVGTFGNPGSTGVGQTSNFDVDRVEIINGPQALLYGTGGPGGVINVVSKQAWIGAPAFGSALFRVDNYGTKYGQFDYGTSEGNTAVRVALVDATDDSRRINIGDTLIGAYVQLAQKVGNTTIRLGLEQTNDFRVNSSYLSLTSASPDPTSSLNADSLGYLLATNQSRALDNGFLNWSNVNSLEGALNDDHTVDEFGTLSVESEWTSWLSTQLTAGLNNFLDDRGMDEGSISFYAPEDAANPLLGNWTMGTTGSFSDNDGLFDQKGKAARFSVLMNGDLFGGRAKSQSIVGIDYVGSRGSIRNYAYFEADSNWNVIVNPASTLNLGRTVLPNLAWSVDNGLIPYPLFVSGTPRITWDGLNYVRALENPFSKALISPANPLGTEVPGGTQGEQNDALNEGIYAVNYSHWMDGRLDSLLGVRLEHAYTYTANMEAVLPTPLEIEAADNHSFNFNAGADYHVLPWLAPYFSVSSSFDVPPIEGASPLGFVPQSSHALGEEVGFKFNDNSSNISGSLALYSTMATNEEFRSSGISNDINPSGLNGSVPSASAFTANARSQGVQLTATMMPNPNWRMRLSAAIADGTMGSTVVWPQYYNDQFYENGAGDVTYADGNVVYVPAAFNSKTLTVTSTTAGAVPLTVTLLSTPSSAYYANPQAINGQIQASSSGGKVLLGGTDPANPNSRILTGAVGLPISDYQLQPALTGVTPVGTVIPAVSGQSTTGYPEFSLNFTSVYTFSSGWIKGFRIGGTASAAWRNLGYYYLPEGVTSGSSAQALFDTPTLNRFDLIAGYSRKLGRVTFSTQLNVTNLFNNYEVILFPNPVSGWATASKLSANFDQQPRSYLWTNTLSF